jgi:N-methylhydantoinase A
VPAPARIDAAGLALVAERFEAEYERLFGRGAALKDAGIELVNYGVDAVGVVSRPAATQWTGGGRVEARERRSAWCPKRRSVVPTPVYDGPALPAGAAIEGPAIIEHPGTTIVVLAGQSARIDERRNTRIAVAAGALER